MKINNATSVVASDTIAVTTTLVSKWHNVLVAARTALGKSGVSVNVTDEWKKRMVHQMHSPMRRLTFQTIVEGVPYYSAMHFVRHKVGIEWTVSTQRSDRTADHTDRHELLQDAPVTMEGFGNFQAFSNMAMERLCSKADAKTREVMKMICESITDIEPMLSEQLRPWCEAHGGMCREIKSCRK